jgi:hypothetical protein
LETVKVDYAPKGVDFYYIYKPLAHPEYNNYVVPVNLEERLMHVEEAKRVLGSSITWLADTMDNPWYEVMARTPNSELIVDPDGRVVVRRTWSDPDALRQDLERLVGAVDNRTRVADLDLPAQPRMPAVAKGIVPRVELPPNMQSIQVEPDLDATDIPFYVKIRAEADQNLLQNGAGTMYLGFHLDPLYDVHWNNEAGPVTFNFSVPDGVTMTPSSGVGPDVDAPADADPREFLLEVDARALEGPLDLDVFYFACDDALTFCIPVQQRYQISLERDIHFGTIRTGADNQPIMRRRPPPPTS